MAFDADDVSPNFCHSPAMTFWRAIAADRYSGGVVGVLLLLTLVFQVIGASAPAAAMSVLHPADICSSGSGGPHAPAMPEHREDHPCILLCQAGLSGPASPPAADIEDILVRVAEAVAPIGHPGVDADRVFVTRHRHARAPPHPISA